MQALNLRELADTSRSPGTLEQIWTSPSPRDLLALAESAGADQVLLLLCGIFDDSLAIFCYYLEDHGVSLPEATDDLADSLSTTNSLSDSIASKREQLDGICSAVNQRRDLVVDTELSVDVELVLEHLSQALANIADCVTAGRTPTAVKSVVDCCSSAVFFLDGSRGRREQNRMWADWIRSKVPFDEIRRKLEHEQRPDSDSKPDPAGA